MNKLARMGKDSYIHRDFYHNIGGVLTLSGQNLSWLGNLPGDIKIEKEN